MVGLAMRRKSSVPSPLVLKEDKSTRMKYEATLGSATTGSASSFVQVEKSPLLGKGSSRWLTTPDKENVYSGVPQSAPVITKTRPQSIYGVDQLRNLSNSNASTCSLPIPLEDKNYSPLQSTTRHNIDLRQSPSLHSASESDDLGVRSVASSSWESLELKSSPLFDVRNHSSADKRSLRFRRRVREVGDLVSPVSASSSDLLNRSLIFERESNTADRVVDTASVDDRIFERRNSTFVFDIDQDPSSGELTFQDLTVTTPSDVFGSIMHTNTSSTSRSRSSGFSINHGHEEMMVNVETHEGQYFPRSPRMSNIHKEGDSPVRRASIKPFSLVYKAFPSRHTRVSSTKSSITFSSDWNLTATVDPEADIILGPKDEVMTLSGISSMDGHNVKKPPPTQPLILDLEESRLNSFCNHSTSIDVGRRPPESVHPPIDSCPDVAKLVHWSLGYDWTRKLSYATDDSSTIKADSRKPSQADAGEPSSDPFLPVSPGESSPPPSSLSSGWQSATDLGEYVFPNFPSDFDFDWSCLEGVDMPPRPQDDPRGEWMKALLEEFDNSPVDKADRHKRSQYSVDFKVEDFVASYDFLNPVD